MVDEPEIGAPVALGLERLEVPLQQALRVRERTVLLHVRGGREQEDLGPDLLRDELSRLDLGRVLPERRALDLEEVPDDEPVELRQCQALQLRVRRADAGVLAEEEEALDLALVHVEGRLVGRVVAVDLRQVVEAKVVRLRGVLAPEGL